MRENGQKSQQIYLYTFVISDGFQVPIYSMLSEVHNMNHITHWFNEFIRLFDDTPNEFVSDMSNVLLNAAARSFGNCRNISEYVEVLFNMIRNPNDAVKKTECFIRIDIAHLVKNITSCDALKMKSAEQRELYIRATCLIIKSMGLQQAERIIHSILVVAKSETKGEAFYTNKAYLDELISGTEPISVTGQNVSVFQNEAGGILDDETYPSDSVRKWLDDLNRSSTHEAIDNEGDNVKNDLQNQTFATFLLKLCELMVLWSGVCANTYETSNTASSANVESYLGQMKYSLQRIIPCRIDEFVCGHIDFINGMLVDASQSYIEFVDAIGGLKSVLVDDFDDDFECDMFDLSIPTPIEESGDTHSTTSIDENCDIQSTNISTKDNSMTENTHESVQRSCIACQNGDAPTGAHLCIKCNKAVHTLDGCSESCGSEEGYGTKRICLSCVAAADTQRIAKVSTKSTALSVSQEMNEKEKWSKPKRSARSYLNPVPNWKLDQRVQSKPKISLLQNASQSSTIYTIDGRKVALRNTCASDAICQLFAALYSYFPHCRNKMDANAGVVKLFEVAIMLTQW